MNPGEIGEVTGRIKRINKTAGREILVFLEREEKIYRGDSNLNIKDTDFSIVRFYLVGVQVGIIEMNKIIAENLKTGN